MSNELDENTLRVVIIRHGQTEHNNKRILQGHLDTELNASGQNEASLAGQRLKAELGSVDGIWSSDLKRCKQSLSAILKISELESNVKKLEYWKELRERSMGDLEGLSVQEARSKALTENKHFHDYGESRQEAVGRLNSAFDKIVDQSLKNDYKNIVIVSHGGVISKFISHLVNDKGFKFSENVHEKDIRVPPNTSFTTVLVDKDTLTGIIKSFGDATHLNNLTLAHNFEQ